MRLTRTVSLDTLEYLYISDVAYATYGETQRKMQLIIPYRPHWPDGETVPLIAFLPGSAWYRQEMYNDIPALANLRKGIRCCIRAVPRIEIAPFPAQVEDVHRAIHYIAEQLAKLFHIDMARTFLMGNSSGGHIALLTALRQAAGIADVSELLNFPIRGVIAESAPSDLFLCAKKAFRQTCPRLSTRLRICWACPARRNIRKNSRKPAHKPISHPDTPFRRFSCSMATATRRSTLRIAGRSTNA